MSRKVFLPGCALSSYSPKNVALTAKYLKTKFPDISVVQKCCGKPTKAVGQADMFHQRFDGLVQDIKYCGADEVIVACQSCMKTLAECDEYKTTSLWELFPEIGLPEELVGKAKNSDAVISVHDSCTVRDYTGIHDGIRWILDELGYKYVEPERTRGTTRCCGFGGMVVPANPDVAFRVMQRRVADFPTPQIVTYCAACRQSMLKAGGQAWHILDLIWGDVVVSGAQSPEDVLSSTLKAWRNRYSSKKLLKSAFK
ncbi:MAG: (Fe-S)-binding protein [Oscillospiraceae bacterium]|jgi:Fe-S oxidoreductase|nr:(Fe-S)-binding protein [Oscillospiraceae bacterium]